MDPHKCPPISPDTRSGNAARAACMLMEECVVGWMASGSMVGTEMVFKLFPQFAFDSRLQSGHHHAKACLYMDSLVVDRDAAIDAQVADAQCVVLPVRIDAVALTQAAGQLVQTGTGTLAVLVMVVTDVDRWHKVFHTWLDACPGDGASMMPGMM